MYRYFKPALAVIFLALISCSSNISTKAEEEVPTTLEQHSSSVSSSSSDASAAKNSISSSVSSSASGTPGAPTSFSFSTSDNDPDIADLTNIRDIAENREVRDYLQQEAIKLMLDDKLIDSEEASVNLVITNEMVMVDKKLLSDKEAEKYRDLLKSKLSMGDVFSYSFRQN